MSNLSQCDPTGRFTGLADLYARCRPTYPDEAVDFILTHCGLGPQSLLVDVGCGTGISTRLFAGRGIPVLGVEPNAEMLAKAQREAGPANGPRPEYRTGRAEATGLPDASADAVLAAQAFHWFDAPAALREFHRILRPGGWVVLLWNERDEADPFTAAYGEVFRRDPKAAALEAARGAAGEPLLTCPLFTRTERVLFRHAQELDVEGVLGRAFSASYVPREPHAAAAFAEAMRAAVRRFARDGQVTLHYATSVYVGQR